MVTVITTKEELTTPVYNGVTGTAGSSDNERPFQYIKDYQEVNFHRTPSCKPLPEETVNGQTQKSSIKGTFFVQIDAIEPLIQISNNQKEQTNDTNYNSSLLLTLTDGTTTIKAITTDDIPNLNYNTKPGSKLLLTNIIPIKDGLFQLSHDNTRFQYGSNTYPRPRSFNRGRGSGSYRPSYEGRRNSRYDNDDNETNFFKRPPPKNTLMDFMTSLKISNDTENEKPKEYQDSTKRRYNNNEQYYQTNNGINSDHQSNYSSNNNNYSSGGIYNDQIVFQQEGINEQLDAEDDPLQANYRERRNPLPPRLQRAQEERSRRNTNRYYDESTSIPGSDINSIYRNDTTSNQSLSSSSSSYVRRGDQTSYIPTYPSTGQQHTAHLNSYAQHANLLGATSSHLAYFQANPGPLTYSLAGITNPPYHNQQSSMGPSYANDQLTFCCGPPYATSTYLPPTVANGFTNDSKINDNQCPPNASINDNEPETIELQTDENNDSGNKSESSLSEQKQTPPSSNDNSTNSQQVNNEQHQGKRRDSNSNPRPRWRIGDLCLARWIEDGEFYYANIVQIQPPCCIVLFRDYNNYEQVHFNDLKIVPQDQQFYSFVPPSIAATSDLNALAASAYFSPRTGYYPPTIDGCLIMPEAPPFPFNSAGTLYMCQPSLTSISRSTRYNTNGFQRRNENGDLTMNSSSPPPSKDSNDTSAIDSTTTSSNDDNQQQDISISSTGPRVCSIADAPLTLVTSDDLRERSTSTESLTSSRYDDEQQSTREEEIRE